MNSLEQTIPLVGVQRLVLDIERADLTVAWEAADMIRLSGGEVDVDHHGEELRVVRRDHDHVRLNLRLPLSLPACAIALHRGNLTLDAARGEIDAQVHRGNIRLTGARATVTLQTGPGNIGVERLVGPLTATTGAGNIRLDGVDGPTTLRTGAGNVIINGGAGALDGQTGAGNIHLQDRTTERLTLATGAGNVIIDGGRVAASEIHTGAGNVRCSATLGLGAHRFTSNVGNVTVGLPRGLPARIEATTTLGAIRTDLPLVTVGQRGPRSAFGRRLVGSLGEGPARAEISLRTARGDIRLDWLDAALTEPFGPSEPLAPSPADDFDSAASIPAAPFLPPIPPIPPIPPTPPFPSTPPFSPTVPTLPNESVPPDAIPLGPVASAADSPTAVLPPIAPPGGVPLTLGRVEPAFLPDPPPAEARPAHPSDDEPRRVLEALAAGEISVAEAESLLTALERRQPA